MKTDVTTVAAVLFNAADVIEEHGWVQGFMGNEHDGFCAVGAIRQAASELVAPGYSDQVVDAAIRYVTEDVNDRVTYWNDCLKGRRRGKRKVVRQLRRTGNRILY